MRDGRSPQEAFIEDLFSTLQWWTEQGEIIVLAIDLNENVIDSKFTSKLESISLVEAIITKHFSCCRSVRTHQQGKIPIDGIFIPSSLAITSAGYYPIG